MIYEALFLPVTQEKEKASESDKEKERKEEKRGRRANPMGGEDRRVRRRHPSPRDPSAVNEDRKKVETEI